MRGFDVDGKIVISNDVHSVEYEPGAMTGLSTVYLRVKSGNKNVPIYINHIDEVIEMLKAAKKAIQAIEMIPDGAK